MSERFAAQAARLAGVAGIAFGWPPDLFWGATPAELGALVAALTGQDGDGGVPPDTETIKRLMEAFPDG